MMVNQFFSRNRKGATIGALIGIVSVPIALLTSYKITTNVDIETLLRGLGAAFIALSPIMIPAIFIAGGIGLVIGAVLDEVIN